MRLGEVLSRFVTEADGVADKADTADTVRHLSEIIRQLRWFWEWQHDHLRPSYNEYLVVRNELLHSFASLGVTRMPPCFHYLTNHVWEDYINWFSSKMLIGEAGEASHARDNARKAGTCRGRSSNSDAFNTWSIIIRNFYAAKELERTGVRQKFVCFVRSCDFT